MSPFLLGIVGDAFGDEKEKLGDIVGRGLHSSTSHVPPEPFSSLKLPDVSHKMCLR